MSGLTSDEIVAQLLSLLREAIDGPGEDGSWFTDNDPDAGLLGTLRHVSAADASRSLGGSTIAAHVHHVVFAMGVSTAWIRGERRRWDWKSSWSLREVDEEGWRRLADRLRDARDELQRAIAAEAAGSADSLAGAVASIAHVAAHLGAIRQKLCFLRER